MKLQPYLLCLFLLIFTFGAPELRAKEWDRRVLQASHLAYQGDVIAAEKTIDEYIDENPDDPNGLFIKAALLEWKISLVLAPEPSSSQTILSLYKEANDLAFQRWYHDPDNVDKMIDLGNSYLFLARKYADLGDNLKAVFTGKKCQKHLQKALKLDPSRTDALLALGGFHYAAGYRGPGALKAIFGIHGSTTEGLEELRKAQTGNHPFVNDARYTLFVFLANYEKNLPAALEVLGDLERQFSENPELKLRKAKALERESPEKGLQGYIELGQWCTQKAGRCRNHYLFLAFYHAGRLSRDLQKNGQAKQYFAKAVTYESKPFPQLTAEAFYWSGLIDRMEGNIPAALEKFDRAKGVSGVPKPLSDEIENARAGACGVQKVTGRC